MKREQKVTGKIEISQMALNGDQTTQELDDTGDLYMPEQTDMVNPIAVVPFPTTSSSVPGLDILCTPAKALEELIIVAERSIVRGGQFCD